MRDFRLACMQTWKDSLFEQLFTFLTNLLTLLTLSDLYLLVVKLIAWIVANITDIIVLISLLECLTFFSHCDQVNQQCEKILIKTPSFPLLCIKVTNLEAMLEYVWMSICIIFIKRKKMRKEKGSCLSMSCSFFSLSRSFFRFVFKVWCYLGFKWPLFIVFWQCECTHIFKWCWGQSIGNSAVWWSMIWACACGQAKGASLTLSYIHTWHVLI